MLAQKIRYKYSNIIIINKSFLVPAAPPQHPYNNKARYHLVRQILKVKPIRFDCAFKTSARYYVLC